MPAILLIERCRENERVKNRTLADLSSLPPQSIEILRRSVYVIVCVEHVIDLLNGLGL
ncbi:MAG: hypothetical protein LWW97_03190 [Deltaproteobacteria bacterium]|nr:hypothetical protein [Deltaproteobacteria bacterium]